MLQKYLLPALFLTALSFAQPSFADPTDTDEAMQKCQNRHPEWYQCATDADCTLSLDACGWPVLGVNKMHKGRSEICTRSAGAFIDCPMWKNTPENKMAVTCQEGVCTGVKASDLPKTEPAPVPEGQAASQ